MSRGPVEWCNLKRLRTCARSYFWPNLPEECLGVQDIQIWVQLFTIELQYARIFCMFCSRFHSALRGSLQSIAFALVGQTNFLDYPTRLGDSLRACRERSKYYFSNWSSISLAISPLGQMWANALNPTRPMRPNGSASILRTLELLGRVDGIQWTPRSGVYNPYCIPAVQTFKIDSTITEHKRAVRWPKGFENFLPFKSASRSVVRIPYKEADFWLENFWARRCCTVTLIVSGRLSSSLSEQISCYEILRASWVQGGEKAGND